MLAVVAALTATAACGRTAAHPAAPAVTSATASKPSSTGAGRLLSATPFTARLAGSIALSARAWRITYDSTDATGGRVVVSGTLLVPARAYVGGPRPLVGYAVGTQGLADDCAASYQLAHGTEYEAPFLTQLLGRGWAVAVTDYPGLGEPGEHPYAVGPALGPAVLDAIRAARQVAPAGLDPSGPAAVTGYSEGGGAAGWAAQLQPTYAPDVPLVGAAVGGVTADPFAIGRSLDGGPYAFLLGYAVEGLAAAYPTLDLDRLLTVDGRSRLDALQTSCFGGGAVTYPAGTRLASLTRGDVFADPTVAALLSLGTLGRVRPTTPILLQHSRSDDILPFGQAAALAAAWCAEGATVDFRPLDTGGHIATGLVVVPPAVRWLADRFAGMPATGTC